MAKETKAKKKGRVSKVLSEFKAFISKGNVLDMAVGVIMGSAFGAIVTAFTNILLSLCTWGVPGGLSGLVTVLPAANAGQRVPTDIFVGGEALKQSYSAADWVALSQQDGFNSTISGMYTNYGGTYYYNKMAIIDWGTFINAIISFLIIALTLFLILKIYTGLKNKRAELEAQLKAKAEANKPVEEKVEEKKEPEPKPKSDELIALETISQHLQAIEEELKKQGSSAETYKKLLEELKSNS